MSKSILTITAIALVTVVSACARAPIEPASTFAPAAVAPVVPLSQEPVYTGKYK